MPRQRPRRRPRRRAGLDPRPSRPSPRTPPRRPPRPPPDHRRGRAARRRRGRLRCGPGMRQSSATALDRAGPWHRPPPTDRGRLAAAINRAPAAGYDIAANLPPAGHPTTPPPHPAAELFWRLFDDCGAPNPRPTGQQSSRRNTCPTTSGTHTSHPLPPAGPRPRLRRSQPLRSTVHRLADTRKRRGLRSACSRTGSGCLVPDRPV